MREESADSECKPISYLKAWVWEQGPHSTYVPRSASGYARTREHTTASAARLSVDRMPPRDQTID